MATTTERVIWDYIDEVSDELVLQIQDTIAIDGFDQAQASETIMMKIFSAALIKVLAINCENLKHPDIGVAYMQMIPMQTELVKLMIIKNAKKKAKKS